MEFQQLRGFYFSAKMGSLTKAAEKMSITQSAVSQQIKALEYELGIKLFNRYGPKKELTPDGELFLNLISPLIQEIDSLKITFEDVKGSQKGVLTIAATTFMIMSHLPVVIKKFKQQYPSVRFTILERRWCEIINLANAGEIDFGITPNRDSHPNLDTYKLDPIERVLITPPDHPLAKMDKITIEDIARHPIVTYEKGLITRKEFDQVFKNYNLEPDVVMEATNAETIKRYVEIGIGIAVIPQSALSTSPTHFVKVIPISEYFGTSCYCVVLRKGKHVTQWSKNFLYLLDPKFEVIF
ncbi:LysR family transcriptional regulator [bacterium]|nr:LysR family transcriptional regulator [bacterium]